MVYIILSVIASGLSVVFHDTIGQWLFDNHFSWTMSKAFPYMLCLIFGLFTLYFTIKYSKKYGVLIGSVLFFTIIGLDFGFHLIYQGDFSNNKITVTTNNPQIEKNSLTVVAIPGCQFCHGSIEMLKVLKERNPNLTINFLECSSDSTNMEQYVEPIDGKFNLALLEDLDELNRLKINSFPTFIYTDSKGNKSLWTNDTFGAPAKDFVENNVK